MIESKRLMVVIPARYNSQRLPGKVAEQIHGYPMIYWVYKRALAANVGRVIVAIDSLKLGRVLEALSIPTVYTSEDCASGTDRVLEAARAFKDIEYFVNVQADEPLISPGVISELSRAWNPIQGEGFYCALSPISGETNNPSEVKALMSFDNRIRIISRYLFNEPKKLSTIQVRYKVSGVYLYSRATLEQFSRCTKGPLETLESVEQLRCIEHDIPLYGVVIQPSERSVDTVTDLEYMRALPRNRFSNY